MAEGGGRQASHVLHLTVATESAASHPLFSPHSVGGIMYVDDYGSFPGCAAAVDEYRRARGRREQLNPIHGKFGRFQAVWWRRGSDGAPHRT